MILFSEALDIILSSAQINSVEEVSFTDSPGRVLAQNIHSDINMPPFDKSAMDGYACREADLDKELELVEVIKAGETPKMSIAPGQCAQIMTGAMVPAGADFVIMVEQSETTKSGKIRFSNGKSRSNICILGEDVQKGDLILEAGTLIGVRHIPVLATVGASKLKVYKQPRVAVLATGTELVEPEIVPGPSQIRNSNAPQMMAQLKSMGLSPVYFGIAPDDEQRTYAMIKNALDQSDILMLSGGVSMGEFDFVPEVLKQLGFELKFQRVAVQPGKPSTFGVRNGKYVIGLPGNPVSSFVIFELLAKPFIYKCMGHDWKPVGIKLPTGKRITRKKASRQSWFPVEINKEGELMPLDYHGSAHIFALNQASGIISMDIGIKSIEKGDWVDVRQI